MYDYVHVGVAVKALLGCHWLKCDPPDWHVMAEESKLQSSRAAALSDGWTAVDTSYEAAILRILEAVLHLLPVYFHLFMEQRLNSWC